MNTSLKLVLAAGIAAGGLATASLSATAMPLSGLDPALASAPEAANGIENIRWVCHPYGGCRRVRGWRHAWGPRYGYAWGYGNYWGIRPWGPYGYYGWYGHPYYW